MMFCLISIIQRRMIKSKAWQWEMIKDDAESTWKNPSVESYYLVNRWKSQEKEEFLDLGCGLGRHSILFGKNGFHVRSFDLSADAIARTKAWAEEEGLKFDYQVGDMLHLPYADGSIDCIMCRNVITHTDTKGVKQVISELYRVLKEGGECFITIASKEAWGFKREDWPLLDENTRVRMDEGPEYQVPHFYADYDLVQKLFEMFEISSISHVEEYYTHNGELYSSYHYHVLLRK